MRRRADCAAGGPQMNFRVLVLVALALPTALAAAGPVAFDLSGCRYFEVEVKVLPEAVASRVPSPFVPRVFADGTVTVIHGAAACATATSDLGDGTASFGWTSVKILAPADPALAGEGIGV